MAFGPLAFLGPLALPCPLHASPGRKRAGRQSSGRELSPPVLLSPWSETPCEKAPSSSLPSSSASFPERPKTNKQQEKSFLE